MERIGMVNEAELYEVPTLMSNPFSMEILSQSAVSGRGSIPAVRVRQFEERPFLYMVIRCL
jgi:hypothetical protein